MLTTLCIYWGTISVPQEQYSYSLHVFSWTHNNGNSSMPKLSRVRISILQWKHPWNTPKD